MKYLFPYLKKSFFLISVIFLCLLAGGCKRKTVIDFEKESKIKDKLLYITSELNSYALCGKTVLMNPDKYYYPEELKKFVNNITILNGNRILFAEKFNSKILGNIESSLFYSELDDASWVDDLLLRLEEERIASEIIEMEETLDEHAEDIERMLSNEIVVNELMDSQENLKFMEYDNEIFIPQKTHDGWTIIHSLKNNVTKTIYDNNFRLVAKEQWNIPSVENALLELKETFEYYPESNSVSKKTVEKKDSLQILSYNEQGLISILQKYNIAEDKKYLVNETKRLYDESKRIISDEQTELYYKNNFKKLDYTFNKKYVYKYNKIEDIPPDFNYYENGELKMKNNYSDVKGTYSSQIFFEGGFSVKTLYKNEVRTRDIYYLNNEVTRVKVYEE